MTPVFFLGYKEGSAKIKPYTIIIMVAMLEKYIVKAVAGWVTHD
jgi:hypothetical protein